MFPSPTFRRTPVDRQKYARFWFRDVDGDMVPTTRLVALVEFFQPEQKVRPSNVFDLHHAIHLLDCDAVLTGDKAFSVVMEKVAGYLPGLGKPIYVPEQSGGARCDPVQAITDALNVA